MAVAKGRTAMPGGGDPVHAGPRSHQARTARSVLYFIQRCATRRIAAIGSHRKLRKKTSGKRAYEIPGIGPSRKRALLHHFRTLKEIERGIDADLGKVPGVSAEKAPARFSSFSMHSRVKGTSSRHAHLGVACDR
jgi:excinuclease ABC subunit C